MRSLRALRSKNFRYFLSGQSLSLIGTWMQKVAVSWIVYRLTGSAFMLGLTMFANLIPSLILSPYVGSFCDRHNRYKILLITQILLAVQAGAFTYVAYIRLDNMAVIIALSLVQGIITAFDTTARQSLIAKMIKREWDLPNAIALNSSMANLTRILGPAIGGIILSTLGETMCFGINFISYFFVIFSLLLMKLELPENEHKKENVWATFKEGYVYLKASPGSFSIILLLAAYSLFVIPFSTLLPVFAKDIFSGNAATFSWFESAAGVGALIGTGYIATLKPDKNMLTIVFLSSSLFAASVLLLPSGLVLQLALFYTLVSGMGMMSMTAAINTYLQTHVEDSMRGRMVSYFIMSYQGLIPVGSLIIGSVAQKCGTRTTVILEGVTGLAASFIFFYFKRKHERRTQPAIQQFAS